MRASHLVVLIVAALAGLIIGAKMPGLASTVTFGLVKAA